MYIDKLKDRLIYNGVPTSIVDTFLNRWRQHDGIAMEAPFLKFSSDCGMLIGSNQLEFMAIATKWNSCGNLAEWLSYFETWAIRYLVDYLNNRYQEVVL